MGALRPHESVLTSNRPIRSPGLSTSLPSKSTQPAIRSASLHFFPISEQERYDGYCNAMHQAGLNARPQGPLANIDHDSLAEQISARRTTAIVCCNDKLAIQAIRSLTARGICVPENVSIFGFDDWISPSL